jgi:two-component system, OmpR family, response regulator
MTDTLTILYVDDDPDIRAIATMSLQLDPSVSVHAVATGEEALAILATNSFQPDAILLDVMMPGMDGVALATAIRRMPGFDDMPLLFMTARARESDIARYRSVGATGVIIKPFDPLSLASEIRKALS